MSMKRENHHQEYVRLLFKNKSGLK